MYVNGYCMQYIYNHYQTTDDQSLRLSQVCQPDLSTRGRYAYAPPYPFMSLSPTARVRARGPAESNYNIQQVNNIGC